MNLRNLLRNQAGQPNKLLLLGVVGLVTIVGVYLLIRSFAATPGELYFEPSSGQKSGDFSVQLRLNAGTESVSAIDVRMTYDDTKLEFVSSNDSTSAFETRAPGGNVGGSGTVTIIRGHQGGVTGDVLVTTLNFRVRSGASGSGGINFTSGQALRAVGGQNIVTKLTHASFTFGTTPPPPTTPGRLYFNPSSGTKNGDFPVDLRLSTGGESVSAIDVRLTYDAAKLDFVSSDDSTSAFETRAPGGNVGGSGTVTIIRGHQAGVTGDVLVTKLNFRVRSGATGTAGINFTSGEALRAVGGTNIVGTRDNATFTMGTVTPPPDTTAPTKPGTPTSGTVTFNSVTINWAASTDNLGVTGYDILRNGTKVGMSTGTSFTDSGVAPSTAYSYTVIAFDAAGNRSTASSALSVTTPAAPPTCTLTGDFNCDQKVNDADVQIMFANWNTSATNRTGDLNNDGKATAVDLSILLRNWRP